MFWSKLAVVFMAGIFFLAPAAIGAEYAVTPTLGIEERYNDNIFLIDEDRARDVTDEIRDETEDAGETLPFEPQLDDYITTLSPGLKLMYDTEKLTSLITLRLDFLWYADLTDLNDTNEYYKGDFGYALTDYTRISVEAGYIKDSNPDRDLESTGLLLGSTIRKRQRYAFQAEHDLTPASGVSFLYRYDKDDFSNSSVDDLLTELARAEAERIAREAAERGEEPPQTGDISRNIHRRIDSRANTFILGYIHDVSRWMPNTTGFSNLEILNYETDETTQNNVMFSIGAEYELSELFKLRGDIGVRYSHEKFDDIQLKLLPEEPFFEEMFVERTQDDWGPVGHLALDYQGEATNASLKFGYDVRPASGRGTLVKRTEFRFDVGRWFAEHFRANAFATYFMNKIDPVSPLPDIADEESLSVHNDIPALQARLEREIEPIGVDEKVLIAGAGLTYDFNRYITLSGSYSYTVYKREFNDSDARRNLVFLRLDFNYPILK